VYDAAGRLKETWVEVLTNTAAEVPGGFEKALEHQYNYKQVALVDTNGNGEIDGAEGYDPIRVTLQRSSSTSTFTNIKVIATGGSGNFSYSYVRGHVSGTNSEISNQIASFLPRSYTPGTQISASIPCNPNASGVYTAYVIKVTVHDNTTGLNQVGMDYYSRDCGNGDGPIKLPE
jgi:hypothetical protein